MDFKQLKKLKGKTVLDVIQYPQSIGIWFNDGGNTNITHTIYISTVKPVRMDDIEIIREAPDESPTD